MTSRVNKSSLIAIIMLPPPSPKGVYSPTATLLEHTLLTQGFMSTSKAVSLIAGDRKIVILRGQFWATHSSVAVGIGNGPRSRRRPLSATQHNPTTSRVGIAFHC